MSALDDVKAAQVELHASTYWKPLSKGWTTTHLYKCDQLLLKAISELQPPPPPTVTITGTPVEGDTMQVVVS